MQIKSQYNRADIECMNACTALNYLQSQKQDVNDGDEILEFESLPWAIMEQHNKYYMIIQDITLT